MNLGEDDLTVEVDLEAQVGDGRRIDVEVGFTAAPEAASPFVLNRLTSRA
ncbi:hypothetical protein RM780_13920 [Streptomyces sp. DSM 44917]|uniref:Uncharacterized protein n=1 Tax=Streptomyces boetiae TaxID=3075541 RepID=A0ABU2L9U7_9ACTN|nr:hypothetical protein [Streptomyces sp. DSM 44917]MDT0308053.1 hypothetical protein [Streptomyces sp. DSM 44917]